MLVAVRRAILLTMLIGLMLWGMGQAALAQSTLRLATLTIDIWPEYDRPASVLVIYRGQFAQDAPSPAQVKIRIPASAEEPWAVASPNPGNETAPVNQWLNLTTAKLVTTTHSGDWLDVAFAPPSHLFTVEFYDKINTVTFDRRYALTWPGDLAADAVSINVREPFGATSFESTPALSPGVQDKIEGLVAHQLTLGGLAAGQPLVISLGYHREDKRTSVEALQLPTPTPFSQPVSAQAGITTSSWPLIAALGVGLALIVGGVIWYVRSQQRQTFRPYEPPAFRRTKGRRNVRTSRVPRTRPGPAITLPSETTPDSTAFCTQCGKRLQPEDIFCSRCGAHVKGK